MKRIQVSPDPATSRFRRPWARFDLLLAVPLLVAGLFGLALAAEDEAAVEKRLADAVRYLASDELQGRGVGTKGIDLAADYIARQFAQLRLKTDLFDGTSMSAHAPLRHKLSNACEPGAAAVIFCTDQFEIG